MAAAPDPIVYYSLDELDALDATVVDESGNGYDGTIVGTIVLSDEGFLGSSYEFDGGVNRIELQRPVQDAFTLAGWIRTATPGLSGTMAFHGGGLFYSDVGGSANDFTVAVLDTKFSFNVGNPNTTVNSIGDIVTDEWVHVAAVREVAPPAISLYINGTLDNRIDHTNGESLTANPLLVIGGNVGDTRYYTGLIDEVKFFDIALSESDIQNAMQADPALADRPSPEDGAIAVSRDVTLSWTPGDFAVSHDLYIGDSFDDVDTAIVPTAAGLDVNSFDPGRLEFDQTYYWRVDEVNDAPDFTLFKGATWGFTTEPIALPIMGITATASSSLGVSIAERTIDGSGMIDGLHGISADDMWISEDVPATIEFALGQVYRLHELRIWNANQDIESILGLGVKDVVVEYSLDGANWTILEGVGPLAQAPGIEGLAPTSTIDFGGAVAQHVRLTIDAVHGVFGRASLSEVQFFYVPVKATQPSPESDASDVLPNVILSWGLDGREASSHKVYFGADANSLSLVDSTSVSNFDTSPLDLALGQSYSWRVDEVNEAETPTTWQGDVWDFTTQEFIVVEDFESYNDIAAGEPGSNVVYETWLDGYGTTTNGSAMGYTVPFQPTMETVIVHGGRQSAPLQYDNVAAAFSEVTRTLAAQDWSRSGITTLSLWAYAGDDNTGGTLTLKINGTQVALVDDGSTYPAGYTGWVQYLVDLATLDVSSVSSLTFGVNDPGAQGLFYVDDMRLYATVPALGPTLTSVGPIIEAEGGAYTDPFELRSDRPEASGGSFIFIGSVGDALSAPPAQGNGWAVYTISIPADGNYQIALRGVGPNSSSDSFWVNIPGMLVNDADLDNSGWVVSSELFKARGAFVWDFVNDINGDDTDPIVFTLTAGQHELQIAHREDGIALDAIAIFSVN